MEPTLISLAARDGFQLAGSLFEPSGGSARTVIIASATAVRRRLYDAFARFLCAQGLRTVTFDYRGIGDSRHGDIRRMRCSMGEWGASDLAGVIDDLAGRFPASRMLLVGHSAGGQMLGLAPNNARVEGMLAVAAQSGYWGHWPRPQRYLLAALWYAVMPGLTHMASRFPAKRLGLGEDLPAGVARQWARWCRHPDYIWSAGDDLRERFAAYRSPILALSFADDAMAPRAAVDALMDRYASAAIERRHIEPEAVGVARIGHFGFFREPLQGSLWTDAAQWLSAH